MLGAWPSAATPPPRLNPAGVYGFFGHIIKDVDEDECPETLESVLEEHVWGLFWVDDVISGM